MSRQLGKRRLSWLAGLCLVGGTLSAMAAPDVSTPAAPQPSSSLLDAWLAFADPVDIQWPYAFITAQDTREQGLSVRQNLVDEMSELGWRLDQDGYADLAETVADWQARIEEMDQFRVPGDWSPAFLLAHPRSQPPIARVAGIGACDAPRYVAVWSAAGYDRIDWQSGMKLSDVQERIPAVRRGSEAQIAVVDPYGRIDHYGVQSWNYADGVISPGTEIVASLPLKGEVFAWMQSEMAKFLAHTPAGVNCREQTPISPEQAID